MIGLGIGTIVVLVAFTLYILGMYNAPQPATYDQKRDLQHLCDEARREPWIEARAISCDYMAEWWALEYKCQEVIGCHVTKGSEDNGS